MSYTQRLEQPNDYTFDNHSFLATAQLASIESYLDPVTARRLAPPVVGRGYRCWEVGAGGGSVARMLARATGPEGLVVATDLNTAQLTAREGLVVRTHDVRHDPVPPGGPFDVIHARLLLLHLPERRSVLRTLAGALAPGGWLVVEEFDCVERPGVLYAPDSASANLFAEVMEAMLGALERRGADLGWARDVYGEMAGCGLTSIEATVHAQSWAGGSMGALLYEVNAAQLRSYLLQTGLDADALWRFQNLMRDPEFAALSYQFVSTRGRRPR